MSSPAREAVTSTQHLSIPFSVPGRAPCTVNVTVEPDEDPERHGQGLVGLYDDPSVTKGFPIMHATVSSPLSRSYAALYGWVQITFTPGEPWVMDLYPLFHDVNSPFFFWGAEPTLIDAPGRQGVENYDWVARSFLCHAPDAAMTKRVVPILGLEWGFWIEGFKPYVKRIRQIDLSVWNGHLELFRSSFVGWHFDQVNV